MPFIISHTLKNMALPCFPFLLVLSIQLLFFFIHRYFRRTSTSEGENMEETKESESTTVVHENEKDMISRLPDHVLSAIISFLPVHEAAQTCVLSKQWKSLWRYTTHLNEKDMISRLPDYVLSAIISFLPAHEAVRTCVLSKRWRSLWKYTTHLNFDQKLMLKPALRICLNSPYRPVPGARSQIEGHRILMLEIEKAACLMKSAIAFHCGTLTSCSILHLSNSCREVLGLMKYLLEMKGVQELSMECEFPESWAPPPPGFSISGPIPHSLDISFKVLSRFRVLKLKNYILKSLPPFQESQVMKTLKLKMVWVSDQLIERIVSNCLSLENLSLIQCKQLKRVRVNSTSIKLLELREMILDTIDVTAVKLEVLQLDTLVCRWNGLLIDAPNLKVLHAYCCDPDSQGMPKKRNGRVLLTTRVILETFCDLLNAEDNGCANIFDNLEALSVDLDLNNVRDIIDLSSMLRSCCSLQTLNIKNQALNYAKIEKHSAKRKDHVLGEGNTSDNRPPYLNSMFWETRELCVSMLKLRGVYLSGFKGKELELGFIKYLITGASMLEKITICFDDDCTWEGVTATVCLLSLGRASAKLSIDLKPGKNMGNLDGDLGKWISALRLN